ncbi:MAG TPA: CpsD/CapB family tyrosine-protein kinase [Candidatus Limnocylindria bacterium]|nr:CpsD/CapB family tyrosine-protein kinase [Candidatus Limnocylindria bacterium]
MTRIFDALRKAQIRRGPAPVAPVPSTPAVSLTPAPSPHSAVARVLDPRPMVPSRFEPLTESLAGLGRLSEDVSRQMASLRVGIESALGERTSRVIVLLSSHRGEGTTTVATQLAVSLAREGRQRTLLVDFNGQRPALGGGPGWLAKHLRAERVRFDEPQQSANGSDAASVDVLPLVKEADEAGMVSLQLAREIIEGLAPRYEWVIVDAPPALETSEAAPLGALADGVVVVIHAGRTKRPVLGRTVDLVRKAGGRVLGTVLNHRRLEIPDFLYRRL